MSFEITVDATEGGTICSLGINENCLGFTQENEFVHVKIYLDHVFQLLHNRSRKCKRKY